jgi:uncharacterized protein involved in exopolysaccharide biosynthesis
MNAPTSGQGTDGSSADELDLWDLLLPLVSNWKLLLAGPVSAALLAYGATYLISPTFTARTTLLSPQPQQGATASALASLSAMSGLGSVTAKTPADQYVALMRSTTVSDRLIDAFKLKDVYKVKFRVDARKKLADNVRIDVGKKDGLITVEVDDISPERAAAVANRFVDELRAVASRLALTEAQQRRLFFEEQMRQAQQKLIAAQSELQTSGFTAGALRAEPRAAAEGYSKLKAEIAGAEVRLQTLRRSLTDTAPETQQQLTALAALRRQLSQLEVPDETGAAPGYVAKYRDFKYHESLFEIFARQYEMARADESRDGPLVQVVDVALPPEKRSKPQRLLVGALAGFGAGVALALFVLMRNAWRVAGSTPATAGKIAALRGVIGRRQSGTA